ncbi:MAG: hypothetical protein ACO29O_01090, partial [Chitinophagaceae bacterium]
GNRQDVVLNSSLNLQLNGYLADSIQLAAAITDNNIPIQPDGNTQNLNEFDQVYIRFSKKNWKFNIGDIDVRQKQGYFLNFFKRLQGFSYENTTKLNQNASNEIMFSGAVAKGKFFRNIFQGLEGNQGPYRLKGANNELFFIVLAGTERVWIDGELLQRGEDQDYVINYNTAELVFTPKRMITKDKRIQVEFEYADRNYLNAQFFISDQWKINKKWNIKVSAYHNNDAKNSPINQSLDSKQKNFLAALGDQTGRALYPSYSRDSFELGKILYRKVDTIVNDIIDTAFVFSVNPNDQLYALSFIDLGQGNGNYILDASLGSNGKVYKWVAKNPAGLKMGRYEPAVLLIAPKKQQIMTVAANYKDKNLEMESEFAFSDFDKNTFSRVDKNNDKGSAMRLKLLHTLPLNEQKGLKWVNEISFENIGSSFKPIERLRAVEFNRDWGLDFSLTEANEMLYSYSTLLKDKYFNDFKYSFSGFQRGGLFSASRNSMEHHLNKKGWRVSDQFQFTSLNDPNHRGFFLRPGIDINKSLDFLKNYVTGVSYNLEHKEIHDKITDSVTINSFSFDVWQAYLKSPEAPNKWGLKYFTRSDRLPKGTQLQKSDKSQNLNLFVELMKFQHHQFKMNATYRKLVVNDAELSSLKPENNFLGRIEYFTNLWKSALTGNTLYEVGSGQEPKRDYAYLQVPAGQGEYTWNDYNSDGLQQLNEFEIAKFRDQAKYIRVYTPTTEFVRAGYLQFNYNMVFNPRVALNLNSLNGLEKIISRLYLQSSLQINSKTLSNSSFRFNPFINSTTDTAALSFDKILTNSFSFNRFSSTWGFDLNNIRSSNRAFLSYGYETRFLNEWQLKTRWIVKKSFNFEYNGKLTENSLNTPRFSNRNYSVKGLIIEPRISYIKGTRYRVAIGYKRDLKSSGQSERSIANSLIVDAKYGALQNTSFTSRISIGNISYNGKTNSSVAYYMLDGLLPGRNFLWTIDCTKRLTSFLELSFQYEGRKSGLSSTVHLGRAQIRALF